jgi:Ca2+-transporting ATPase
VLVGQWLIVTFGGKMFRTVPLAPLTWLYIIAGTSPVLWIGELYRKFFDLKGKASGARGRVDS